MIQLDINQIEKTMIKSLKKDLIITCIAFVLMIVFEFIVYINHFSPVVTLCFFLRIFVCISSTIRVFQIKKLKNDDELHEELKHIIRYVEYEYILTENYIIKEYSKKETLKYEDVVLMYKKLSISRYDGIYQELYLITNKGRKYGFIIESDRYDEPKDFSDILLEKNPNVLIEKTKENKRILLEKYGIKL